SISGVLDTHGVELGVYPAAIDHRIILGALHDELPDLEPDRLGRFAFQLVILDGKFLPPVYSPGHRIVGVLGGEEELPGFSHLLPPRCTNPHWPSSRLLTRQEVHLFFPRLPWSARSRPLWLSG